MTADSVNSMITGIYAIWALWVWGNGLIGIARTGSIKSTYGNLISGGWAFVRLLRSFLTVVSIVVILGNLGLELAGVDTELLASNVLGVLFTIFINYLVITHDKKRFYNCCDKSLARRIIRAERQMGYSILTRISLLFLIGSLSTLFVMTDTADYYRDKKGNIYRVKDPLSL